MDPAGGIDEYPIVTRSARASGRQFEDEHGHVVMLGGTCGELVAGGEEAVEDFVGGLVAQLAGGVETAGLAFRHYCGIALAE